MPVRVGFWYILCPCQGLASLGRLVLKCRISLIFCFLDDSQMFFCSSSNCSSFILRVSTLLIIYTFIYITIYISINYKGYKRNVYPSFFNWNNWNWNAPCLLLTFFYKACDNQTTFWTECIHAESHLLSTFNTRLPLHDAFSAASHHCARVIPLNIGIMKWELTFRVGSHLFVWRCGIVAAWQQKKWP